jgi:predicted  nucleic acid-binding Zn-ribbon protein
MLELQRLDQTLAALRAELEGMPKKLREADAKLNGDRAALVSAKEALTHVLGERKKLELDVEQWRERAKKYRGQSSSVKTNEAYKALQHEIAGAEAEASKGEDRVLEQMMAVEEAERRMKRLEAELKESEKTIAAEKQQIEALFAEKKKSWEAATAERKATAKKMAADLLELYERVAKKHPGTVMAQVREGQCRGCGVRVLPHTIQLLESDTDEELFRCESCGRIFYSLEPIPHATPQASANGAANG